MLRFPILFMRNSFGYGTVSTCKSQASNYFQLIFASVRSEKFFWLQYGEYLREPGRQLFSIDFFQASGAHGLSVQVTSRPVASYQLHRKNEKDPGNGVERGGFYGPQP